MKLEDSGERLLQKMIALTGLPEDLIRSELDHILAKAERNGHRRETLTLEELRMAMMEYLESLHLDLSLEEAKHARH